MVTRYTIDYQYGIAHLYTPSPHWLSRFEALAHSCWGLRENIGEIRLLSQCPVEYSQLPYEYERLCADGDEYIWRRDGARRMLRPFPDIEWNETFCEKCKDTEFEEETACS